MKRVLIIGGPDVDLRMDFIQGLQNEFEVVTLGSDKRLRNTFEGAGLKFYYYPMTRSSNPFADIVTMLVLVFQILSLRPDVVHAFDTKPTVYARLAAVFCRVPIIFGTITGLGTLFMDQYASRPSIARKFYVGLQRLACQLSSKTIFFNRDDLEYFVNTGICEASRAEMIPGSGVSGARFQREDVEPDFATSWRAKVGIDEGATLVALVGRMIVSKGVRIFFEAARVLMEDGGGCVKFVLIGPEDEQSSDAISPEELRSYAPFVTWMGGQRPIEKALLEVDILVLPSEREGVPRVLIEGSFAGLAMVASDLPGCRSVIVHGQTGLLVAPGSVSALVDALRTLLNSKEERLRLGQNALAQAKELFDVRVIVEKNSILYRKELAKMCS